jgi:predicted RNA-binding Zn-ribbon protein involved in translation (DUF1610 family)
MAKKPEPAKPMPRKPAPTKPASGKPIIVKPGQDYLAVVCYKCGQLYPIEGSTSPKTPKDPPAGPRVCECPFCGHQAVYRPEQVQRMTGSHEE